MMEDEPVKKEPKVETTLVDPHRSEDIAAFVASLTVSVEALGKSVLALDETVLTEELLSELLRVAPSAEERSRLGALEEEERAQLGPVEQFLLEMAKIDRCAPRLECLLYTRQFEERLAAVEQETRQLVHSSQVLRESPALETILGVVLAIGNYLNGATPRGGAHGFKLDALGKLSLIRATTHSPEVTSLLDYLARLLQLGYPETMAVYDEAFAGTVAAGSAVDLHAVDTILTGLHDGLKFLQKELPLHHTDNPDDSPFVTFMTVKHCFFFFFVFVMADLLFLCLSFLPLVFARSSSLAPLPESRALPRS